MRVSWRPSALCIEEWKGMYTVHEHEVLRIFSMYQKALARLWWMLKTYCHPEMTFKRTGSVCTVQLTFLHMPGRQWIQECNSFASILRYKSLQSTPVRPSLHVRKIEKLGQWHSSSTSYARKMRLPVPLYPRLHARKMRPPVSLFPSLHTRKRTGLLHACFLVVARSTSLRSQALRSARAQGL